MPRIEDEENRIRNLATPESLASTKADGDGECGCCRQRRDPAEVVPFGPLGQIARPHSFGIFGCWVCSGEFIVSRNVIRGGHHEYTDEIEAGSKPEAR